MGVSGFYSTMFGNLGLFIFLAVSFAILHFFLFRKIVLSLFDPMLLPLVSLTFNTIDVVFMYFAGTESAFYFCHYLITQTLFLVGFFAFRPLNLSRLSRHGREQGLVQRKDLRSSIYVIASLVLVGSQMASFAIVGVPLFMEARLAAYATGGGIGILGRISSISNTIVLYLLIEKFLSNDSTFRRVRFADIFMLLFCLLSLVSVGNKSSILSVVQMVFLYQIFMSKFGFSESSLRRAKLFQWVFFWLAIVTAIGVILYEVLKSGSPGQNPVLLLIYRFIQSGDAFMNAYQGDVLDQMQKADPLLVIFADFLGMFRFVQWDEIPRQLGNQLVRFIEHTELPKGSNPVHNLFGLFYFGYFWSLFYSFGIGLLVSYARNRLVYKMPPSVVGGIFYVLLFNAFLGLIVDISYSVEVLDNILVVAVPIYLVAKFLSSMRSGSAGTPLPEEFGRKS